MNTFPLIVSNHVKEAKRHFCPLGIPKYESESQTFFRMIFGPSVSLIIQNGPLLDGKSMWHPNVLTETLFMLTWHVRVSRSDDVSHATSAMDDTSSLLLTWTCHVSMNSVSNTENGLK